MEKNMETRKVFWGYIVTFVDDEGPEALNTKPFETGIRVLNAPIFQLKSIRTSCTEEKPNCHSPLYKSIDVGLRCSGFRGQDYPANFLHNSSIRSRSLF